MPRLGYLLLLLLCLIRVLVRVTNTRIPAPQRHNLVTPCASGCDQRPTWIQYVSSAAICPFLFPNTAFALLTWSLRSPSNKSPTPFQKMHIVRCTYSYLHVSCRRYAPAGVS